MFSLEENVGWGSGACSRCFLLEGMGNRGRSAGAKNLLAFLSGDKETQNLETTCYSAPQ